MTVQELIDALSYVRDKSLPVKMTNWRDQDDHVARIEISDECVEIIPSQLYGDESPAPR